MPIEPLALHADAMDLELDLQSYERPLAVSPEMVPDWQDAHAMMLSLPKESPARIRNDLGVRTFQGLGKEQSCQRTGGSSHHSPTCILTILLNLWNVNPVYRCPWTVVAFLIVAMQLRSLVTLRLLLCIAFNRGWWVHRPCPRCSVLPFFLRGGGGSYLLFKN